MMTFVRKICRGLRANPQRLHADSSGAVALMSLAAVMILLMMSWIVLDTGRAAMDKMDVQIAADTAAYSQSSIEARSMNLLAFANIGKRLVFGMTSFYQALWLAWTALFLVTVAITIACWALNVAAKGGLTAVCKKLTKFLVEITKVMGEELPDLIVFEADLNHSYFKKDLEAFDKYQKYLVGMAPWWSYSEALQRGFRNSRGRAMVASWPTPKLLTDSTDSVFGMSGKKSELPVERVTNSTDVYKQMCFQVYSKIDILVHEFDYFLKSRDQFKKNYNTMIAFPLAGVLALGTMLAGCGIQMGVFGEVAQPYQVKSYTDHSEWLLASSKLAFTYAPDHQRMSDEGARQKYFMGEDYRNLMPLVYDGGGYWGMARAEIVWRSGTPSLWEPGWSARMRPAALPGEWSGLSDTRFRNAWRDMLPYLLLGGSLLSALDGIINENINFGNFMHRTAGDFLRMEFGADGMTDRNMEGIAR